MFTFPQIFDHRYYTSRHGEAAGMSREKALIHFLSRGKQLGYGGSPMAEANFFISFLKKLHFKSILEIGPGVNPIMKGDNVSYYDVRQGEEFLDYARSKGIAGEVHLPKIDFYSADGSLKNISQNLIWFFHRIVLSM